MLVRLNQLDPRSAENVAGWTTGGVRGTVAYAWPPSAFAYQLLVLDRDEAGAATPLAARQAEVRRLLPAAVAAICRPGDTVVVRLDGPFGPGLLPDGTVAALTGGFSLSGVQRLTGDATPPQASLRRVVDGPALAAVAADDRLALYAGVRFRAVPLPADLVDPMLDTADPGDERWPDLLPRSAGVVSTAADLTSLVLWTTSLGPDALHARLGPALAGRPR